MCVRAALLISPPSRITHKVQSAPSLAAVKGPASALCGRGPTARHMGEDVEGFGRRPHHGLSAGTGAVVRKPSAARQHAKRRDGLRPHSASELSAAAAARTMVAACARAGSSRSITSESGNRRCIVAATAGISGGWARIRVAGT